MQSKAVRLSGEIIMFRHLRPFVRPYLRQFIVGPFFKLLEAVLELTLPILLAGIIDRGIEKKDTAYIYHSGLIMFLIIVIGFTSALICQYAASVASTGFAKRLRSALFFHVNTLSLAELDQLGTDTLTTRVTNDVTQLQTAVSMTIRLLVRAPFVSIGCVVAAMLIDLPLSGIIWIGVITFILVLAGIMATAFPLYGQVQARLDGIAGIVREGFSGVRVIRAFVRKGSFYDRFRDAVEKHAESVIHVLRIASLMNPLTMLIMNLGICAILWFGGLRIDSGELTPGELVAFINYIGQVLVALIAVANLVVIFTKASASLKRVNEILDRETTVADPEHPAEAGKESVAVSFENVSFAYATSGESAEEDAISDISFAVSSGQVMGIIGGTGSGKSTILSLITRFYDARAGQIRIGGTPITDLRVADFRRRIGCVFQSPKIFSGTIAENLRWGNPDASEEELREACRLAQAAEFIDKLPDGYRTRIERDGRNLSGGQKQRLAIARALVRRPEILLLDDATSALDFTTESKLRAAIEETAKRTKMTVILVSQRVAAIRNADVILVLRDGACAGLGTHAELMATSETYRAIALSQLSEEEVK